MLMLSLFLWSYIGAFTHALRCKCMLLLNAAYDELRCATLRCAASACRCVHTYAALRYMLLLNAAYDELLFEAASKAALKQLLKQLCFWSSVALNCIARIGCWKYARPIYNELIYTTSCPGAPVAPRHAASCHADQHYVQSRNMKYPTFRDPGG